MDCRILAVIVIVGWISGANLQRARAPPQIIEPSTDQYDAPAGRTFSLQCVAPLSTQIEWYFENRRVYTGRQSDFDVEEKTSYSDNQKFSTLTTKAAASTVLSGEYRCQDSNNRGSFDMVDVTVTSMSSGGYPRGSSQGGYDDGESSYGGSSYGGYDSGMGTSRSSVDIVNPRGTLLEVIEGRDLSLECRGPSTIQWYVDGRQAYETRTSPYEITTRMDYQSNKMISIISNRNPATSQLSGEYVCRDANDRSSFDTVDVTVSRHGGGQNSWGNNGAGYASSTSSSEGGFASKPLVFSTILFEPYTMESENRKAQGNDRFIGFIPDLVKELADRLDFDYELRLVKDNKWGARDSSTGKWNGMIGEVIRGEADCAAAPLVISQIRTLVVDFTDPYMDTNLAVLLHKNSTIRTLEDLLHSNYSYGTLDMGWNKAIMMSSTREPYASMWSQMASSEDQSWFVHNNEVGVLRVLEEEFGYILRKPMAEYFAQKDCRLRFVEMALGNEGYGFALPKHHGRLGEFNVIIRDMQREGRIEEIKMKWWYRRPCPYPEFANTGNRMRAMILGVVLCGLLSLHM